MSLDTTVGGAASDSYATLAEYTAFAAAYGYTLEVADAANEVNLRKAVRYIDQAYFWMGWKTTDAQALEWPRFIDGLVDNYTVPSDAIPQKIKDAQMEMAFLIQGGTTPLITLSGGAIIRKREKVDVIEEETEYSAPREREAYPIIDALVGRYANGKIGTSSGSFGLMRA